MQGGARHPSEEAFKSGDSLRAIASGMVFFFHVFFGAAAKDGFHPRVVGDTGVALNDAYGWADPLFEIVPLAIYIFFSLSGYLLSRRFVRSYIERTPRPSRKDFLRNRMLRIFPAFWFVTAISFLNFGVGGSSTAEILAVPAFAQVYLQGPVTNTIAHAWSIDTEWALYLCIPLAAALVPWATPASTPRAGRFAVVLAGIALVFVVCLAFREFGATGTWYQRSFWSVGWAFVPGLLLAVAEVAWAERWRGAAWGPKVALAVLALWLPAVALYVSADLDAPGLRAVLASVAVGALLAGPLLLQWTTGRTWWLLDNPALRWVGERSYSFYLIHFLVGVEISTRFTEPGSARQDLLFTLPLALILSLLASHLIYRFVEAPFLKRKRRQAPTAGAPGGHGVAGDDVVAAR